MMWGMSSNTVGKTTYFGWRTDSSDTRWMAFMYSSPDEGVKTCPFEGPDAYDYTYEIIHNRAATTSLCAIRLGNRLGTASIVRC